MRLPKPKVARCHKAALDTPAVADDGSRWPDVRRGGHGRERGEGGGGFSWRARFPRPQTLLLCCRSQVRPPLPTPPPLSQPRCCARYAGTLCWPQWTATRPAWRRWWPLTAAWSRTCPPTAACCSSLLGRRSCGEAAGISYYVLGLVSCFEMPSCCAPACPGGATWRKNLRQRWRRRWGQGRVFLGGGLLEELPCGWLACTCPIHFVLTAPQPDIFGGEAGAKVAADLRLRVVEHNIAVAARYYTRISTSRLAQARADSGEAGMEPERVLFVLASSIAAPLLQLLDLSPEDAERHLADMVVARRVSARCMVRFARSTSSALLLTPAAASAT